MTRPVPAGEPVIDCLCGDRFATTEDMALHLWMAHGHEVPPVPAGDERERLRAALHEAFPHNDGMVHASILHVADVVVASGVTFGDTRLREAAEQVVGRFLDTPASLAGVHVAAIFDLRAALAGKGGK